MLRLGWFSSGRDDASRKLLATICRKKREGFLDIDIPFVFCDRSRDERGEGPEHQARQRFFDQVDELGIPLVARSSMGFRPDLSSDETAWRAEFGEEVLRSLSAYRFDLGVVADCAAIPGGPLLMQRPLICIRPALPGGPAGSRQEVVWNLISSRADRHGATVQRYTAGDLPAPLAYCSFAIRGPKYNALWLGYDAKVAGRGEEWLKREEGELEPLFSHIRHDEAQREGALLAYFLKPLCDGKFHIKGERLFEGDRPFDRPLDLTRDVERALQNGEFKEEAAHGL